MAGGPQNIFTEKKSAHLKAMIDQVKAQMGGNPTILRTPVKVQNGQILLQGHPNENLQKKYPYIKMDSAQRVIGQSNQQKLVLY
jgi:uncharacterized protein (DUF433 family)